ncbi:LamB/YcsF family protein [Lachnospiraceae bacterium ZAX-1]
MHKVDLNCDLGESFGVYKLGEDAAILAYITSANVACGFHASDPLTMAQTVANAKASGVSIGAHPGFPDLLGFGRRAMQITPQEAKAYIQYQVGALLAFCKSANVPLVHVKPHGALYNMAARDIDLSYAICNGIKEISPDIILLAQSGSKMLEAAQELGLPFASEVFADRTYQPDASLTPRSHENAVIGSSELAIAQTIQMVKEGTVTATNGQTIPIRADSICIHGDSPKALQFAKEIYGILRAQDIVIAPLGGF